MISSFSLNIIFWIFNKWTLTAGLGVWVGALNGLQRPMKNGPHPYVSAAKGGLKSVIWIPTQIWVFVSQAYNEGFFSALGGKVGETSRLVFSISNKFLDKSVNDYASDVVVAGAVVATLTLFVYWRLEVRRHRAYAASYFRRKGLMK